MTPQQEQELTALLNIQHVFVERLLRLHASYCCAPMQSANRQGLPCFHGPFQLSDCEPVLIAHHNGKLFTGTGELALSIGMSVAIYSALHTGGTGFQLCQLEVVLKLVEAYARTCNNFGVTMRNLNDTNNSDLPSLVTMRNDTGAWQ